MKKRFAVLISLFSLVVLFLTGCSNERIRNEDVVAINENVIIISEHMSNSYENTICYFDGEGMKLLKVEITNDYETLVPPIKVDKLIQHERYFKVIIGDKEFVFSNNYYSYRIL